MYGSVYLCTCIHVSHVVNSAFYHIACSAWQSGSGLLLGLRCDRSLEPRTNKKRDTMEWGERCWKLLSIGPWLLFAAFSVESCNGVGAILDVRVNPAFLRETYSLHGFVWKWGQSQMATLIVNMLSHEPPWTSLLVSDCPTPDPWRFGILLPWHRNMEDMEGMLRHRWIRWS